jgi:hypothetical protein
MLYSRKKERKHLKDCEPIYMYRELNKYFHSKCNKDDSIFILQVQNMSHCISYFLEIIYILKYMQKKLPFMSKASLTAILYCQSYYS